MLTLAEKIALITGGGAGIGKGIAELFAELGATTLIIDLDASRANEASAALQRRGMRAHGLVADVTDHAQVTKIFEEIEAQFGRLDVLVNNVGGELGLQKPFVDTTDDECLRLYDANLRHAFLVTRAAIPLMRRGSAGGSIISISTIEAYRGIPISTVYSAFKSALTGFTRSLALELAQEGIRVNAIAPETTETGPPERSLRVMPEHLDRICDWIPLGRFGRPRDIAGAAAFLASDFASWITGTTVHVDGGALAAGGWVRMPNGHWTHRPLITGSGYQHH